MSGENALYFLLQKITTAVLDYKSLKDGAGYQLDQLRGELRRLEAFLKDSANKSEKTATFKETEKSIRELAYDVEDTIEICLTKNAAEKTNNMSNRLGINLSTVMEKEVKTLRQTHVAPIIEKIPEITSLPEVTKADQPMEQPPLDQSHKRVVDFEDESAIMYSLMESKENIDVIAITGMPGLGKTTFARKIFEHEKVINEFQLRIWVCISENFDSRNAFLHILKQIIPGRTHISKDEDLIYIVRRCLEKEPFLLVMDDVWTTDDWNVLKGILPEKNGKGKVMVTTREKEVAAHVNIFRFPHELKELRANKSLELLKLKVFDKLEGCPEGLEDVVKDVATKCGGVPLTILAIGGILKDVFTKTRSIPAVNEKWSEVSKNLCEILEDDKKKTISDALELSYKRLPQDVRVCFLYTGLFPENHNIPASTLTQLWIAEGFIQRKVGQTFEQNAEKILDTLINKNLLMVVKENLDQVKTCCVHDMIRGFCRTKAIEENLFREIKISNGVLDPPVSEVPNFRRLCFNSDPTNFFSEFPKPTEGQRARSFLCVSKESVDLDPKHISIICAAFNKLRVLNCQFITFPQFPELEKLVLLKHVTLSIGKLNVLPKLISELVNLQTLIVDTTSQSITVKANILQMIQLRRLITKAAIFLNDSNWKGKACKSNLQMISRLSPESCKKALSERAPNLKTLNIQGKVANLFSTLPLEKFLQLEKLKLNGLCTEPTGSPDPLVLTQPDRFSPNLKSLTLSNTYLKWKDHMPMLAKINTLKVLKLRSNAFIGIKWDIAKDADGFPKLQFLLIENNKLVDWNWTLPTNYFPTLTWLVVKNCKELLEIPESLADLKYLDKLEIERVQKSVADSAQKIVSKKQAEQNQNSGWQVPFKLTIGQGCGY